MASANPGATPVNTGAGSVLTGKVLAGEIPVNSNFLFYSEILINSGAVLNNFGVIPVNSFPMNQDVPVSSVMTNFSHQIIKKLNDKNFLLWRQVEPAISALGLNCFVASPQIPPWYRSDADRDLDRVNPLFSLWQKQDKFLLFGFNLLFRLILARVLGSTHSYQVWDKIHTYFHH